MFSGQGSQYVGMCKELYDTHLCVKKVFDQADQILGYSISNIMFEQEELLNQTVYTQVAMFTMYAGILELLKEQKVESEFSVGLSLGEYGALLHNQVFDFETGLKLLQKRGEVMDEVSKKVPGKMSAILGIESDVLLSIIDEVDGYVKIANYNTYGQLVISGEEDAVLKVNEAALNSGAKRAILLNTSGPFHTDLMNEASMKLKEYIETIEFNEPRYKLLVNTTGDYFKGSIKEEMVSQITSSVMFYQMIEKLLDDGVDTFIEIGPKKTLSSFVKKINRTVTLLHVEDNESLQNTLNKLEVI
jgi:[acyl-carrier-protein] S-malonyltransferase